MIIIGVLAFQGDVREHHEALRALDVSSIDVRSIEDFEKIDALIIPGGESTVISKFLTETGLRQVIIHRVQKENLPIYGTCAGAILLASEILHEDRVEPMKLIDITVERNAYGRQAESFHGSIFLTLSDIKEISGTFIRAPKIVRMGLKVSVLGTCAGEPVLCRQGNILISTFHPELSPAPPDIHRYFLSLATPAFTSPSAKATGDKSAGRQGDTVQRV